MKKTTFALIVALMGWAHLAPANLVITEVMSSSAHPGGTPNEDWFELTNFGSTAINLDGYYWDDDGENGNDGSLFPAITLDPGTSLVILRDSSAVILDFMNAWGGGFDVLSEDDFGGPDSFSGLSSGGDQIQIWDTDPNAGPANLVAEVFFGASTEGSSFEWDHNGNSLGLSVTGENGAFQALSDGGDPAGPGLDIASPGFAIPEPNVLALLGLSALLLHLFRRNLKK
ncbi:lamin tail domain-containing protein [Kiritimatiellaeota bacterium B1221]|nr:lamin tail domain-containing protein [Kiritimatiellaeota bacterium B1221]